MNQMKSRPIYTEEDRRELERGESWLGALLSWRKEKTTEQEPAYPDASAEIERRRKILEAKRVAHLMELATPERARENIIPLKRKSK
jgi:hypothetical protein